MTTRTPLEVVEDALERTGHTIRNGSTTCPAHDDSTPSLSVDEGDGGRVLVNCHAGCATEDVVSAIGLTMKSLFPPKENGAAAKRRVVAEYVYHDEQRRPLYRVLRWSPKSFSQERWGASGWVGGKGCMSDVERVLFGLPELLTGVERGATIYVAEGEKDVQALRRAGHVATCNAGGAGKWSSVAAQARDVLAGADVVVVADRDTAGWAHARDVVTSLDGVAASVRVVEAAVGKDAADHLGAGRTVDEFVLVDLDGDQPPDGDTADDAQDDDSTFTSHRIVLGGAFVLDTPEMPPALVGEGDRVLWAEGESLLLIGPPGVGKTTVTNQLVAGQLGVEGFETFLGMPVAPIDGRLLYLAMDRPQQIQRSMRRIFGAEHRALLDDRLIVWKGPLANTLNADPEVLVEMCKRLEVDALYVDSLKDAAVELTDDKAGGAVNRALQQCLAEGVQVAVNHHQRKGQGEGSKPKALDDVYGSRLITAGAGSVVMLWGQAGDLVVELLHLKQPVNDVGPLTVEHDHAAGRTRLLVGFDPLAFLRNCGNKGTTVSDAAKAKFSKANPSANEQAKARRDLERLVVRGLARRTGGERGGAGGTSGARYFACDGLEAA